MNNNEEGYIDSIPAMNAPGRKSLAGYKDPNLHIVPHSFKCLGTEVVEAVEKLIDNLFVNDIPQLEKGGKLRLLGATNARGVGRERRGNLRGGCMSKLCVE
jgi:hypothetical protein